jgi:antitoxin CcdA
MPRFDEMGFPPDVIELQLAHAEPDQVRAAYNRGCTVHAHIGCALLCGRVCALSPRSPMPRRRSVAIPKRATNVSVRSDLLIAAREAGVNLSATLERALTEELAEAKRKKWRQENRASIAAYNEHVEKNGVFSDDVRSF